MMVGREYPAADTSASVRREGIQMYIDGDGEGTLTVTTPDAPGEIGVDEEVVWITFERSTSDATARMSGYVPLSEFQSLVEWASEFGGDSS